MLTAVSIGVGIFTLDWMTYYELAHRGIRTQGRVTAKEPENHRFVRYSYSIGGDGNYSGFGVAGNGNPEFDNINVGDPVVVYYSSDNPAISFLGEPRYQLNSVTRGVAFIALVLPVFVLIAIRIARRRRQRSSGPTL